MENQYQPWENTVDTSFLKDAACRGMATDREGQATNTFYPAVGASVKAAKEICNGIKPTRDHHGAAPCPVRQQCLEYALQLPGPSFGIWGGKTERERRAIKREAITNTNVTIRTTVKRPIMHGTSAGYEQHRRRGETPCKACKEGHSKASQAWRDRTNDRKTMPALQELVELIHAENARASRITTGS